MSNNGERKRLTFHSLAEQTLERVRRPLTPFEIWEESKDLRQSQGFQTTGKTPWDSISAQLYVDVRDNPNSSFYQYSKRPSRFYLKKYEKTASIAESAEEMADSTKEVLLHPLLVRFIDANENFRAKALTIHHQATKSMKSQKGWNEWLHPDIVAVRFPYTEYGKEVTELQKEASASSIRLFSFEMKVDLNFGNVRQAYFQAVSNSSWANEGYLVAINIDRGQDFMEEMRRLNNAFGIGIIQLNAQEIDQSEILFSARTNEELDWSTIDRLNANPDFRNFLRYVSEDMRLGKTKSPYEEVLKGQKFEDYVREKSVLELSR